MTTIARILFDAEDVTLDIEDAVHNCLDWFTDEPRISTETFIDCLCDRYGGTEWDIENYDTPAVRRIMSIARDARRSQ